MSLETAAVSPESDTSSGAGSGATAPAGPALVAALTGVLVRACRQLGKAGRPSDASRLAAEGWSLLWTSHPDAAERLNGVMHHLARLEQELEARNQETRPGAPVPTQNRIIDVRQETPKRRHEIIFDTFDALEPGGAYVLVNDHDPKPLWYQFAAEHEGQFTWDALEEGPEVWRVRIGRVAKT